MPTFIWHIDGAAVIFDWEFSDLGEALGCCLFRQVFTDNRWGGLKSDRESERIEYFESLGRGISF